MTPVARKGGDRTAITALFVMFALLVQLIAPAKVMAAPGLGGALTICTGAGVTHLSGDASPSRRHADGAGCPTCLAAAPAIVSTPDLGIQPVAYEAARVEHATTLSLIAPRARAPPRPPSQGPPTA